MPTGELLTPRVEGREDADCHRYCQQGVQYVIDYRVIQRHLLMYIADLQIGGRWITSIRLDIYRERGDLLVASSLPDRRR